MADREQDSADVPTYTEKARGGLPLPYWRTGSWWKTCHSCGSSTGNSEIGDSDAWTAFERGLAPAEETSGQHSGRIKLSFKGFCLYPDERLLLKDDSVVPLGSRALDILLILIARAGELVTKQELIAAVWPDVSVEEVSLRVHITSLRKILDGGQSASSIIRNVSGRGYCFVAPISGSTDHQRREAYLGTDILPHVGPRLLSCVIGRESCIAAIAKKLLSSRFVTITGAGGAGKTTVALASADRLGATFADGVYFVDFERLTSGIHVAGALISALGLMPSPDPFGMVLAFLRTRRALLVLDNCEHLLETIASLAELIVRDAPGVHLLATSREPLRAGGEHVYRLPSLAVPPEGCALTAEDALSYPAVQFFIERVAAGGYPFEFRDEDAPVAAAICRRLDGVALALELVAGRVDAYGLHEVAGLLDTKLKLSWKGARTAIPRHQTLNATLDWSYNLLSETERQTLCRLSVFKGFFSLQAAQAVCSRGDADSDVASIVAILVSKSLISTDLYEGQLQYRLPHTAHIYLTGKLSESGELHSTSRRHALFFCRYIEDLEDGSSTNSVTEQVVRYREVLDNVRTALEWSFSDAGDLEVAKSIVSASIGIFLALSLFNEGQEWTRRAIATFDNDEVAMRREMALSARFWRHLAT
jgi:predicted ATPase/DNA-binding winged helix-turn-helix (wHTH) protein